MEMNDKNTSSLQRIARWLGGMDLLVLLLVLLIVASVWLFFAVAGGVEEGDLQKWDERIYYALRDPETKQPYGPTALKYMARDVTSLGGHALIFFLTLFVLGYLLLAKKYHALLLLLAAVIGGALLSAVLKELFARERPDLAFHLDHATSASFPSGHSIISAVVFLTLGALLARLVEQRRLKMYFIGTALFLTFLVGVSRVYLGVHWPSDVVAGWTVGLAWAIICWIVARALQRKHMVEPPQ